MDALNIRDWRSEETPAVLKPPNWRNTQETETYEWLHHYEPKGGRIFFLGVVDTGLSVSENLASLAENTFIAREDLNQAETASQVKQLVNAGIIVPNTRYTSESNKVVGEIMIIQPHSDDFALSCGATLAKMRAKNKNNLRLVTVFSNYSTQSFPWANRVSLDDDAYSALRKAEDQNVARYLGCPVEFLTHSDALRRSPGSSFIQRAGMLKRDYSVRAAIASDLTQLIEAHSPSKVFLPAGFGWHIDHRTVLSAGLEAAYINSRSSVYLYEDYPYSDKCRYSYWTRIKELHDLAAIEAVYTDVIDFVETKAVLINFYRSQFVNWCFRDIKKSVYNLAEATSIEDWFQKNMFRERTGFAERIWHVPLGNLCNDALGIV